MNGETKRTPAKESLPPEVAEAIEATLWFYWREQLEAFAYDPPEPDEPHGFRDLVVIDRWFYGHDASAEELAAEFDAENEAAVEGLMNTRDE